MEETFYQINKWVVLLVCVIAVALIITIINLITRISRDARDKNQSVIKEIKQDGLLREKDLEIQKIQSEITNKANDLAGVKLEEWKEKELERHREVIWNSAVEKAKALLNQWIIDEEKGLRKDAVARSMGVNFGKITEHLLPFSSHLSEFDPRDIRFIGSPVDLMIFSGATSKKGIIDIYFVEIKTGTGQLSKKQRTIRDAIENHRVHWKPIVVPEFQWDVSDDEPDS